MTHADNFIFSAQESKNVFIIMTKAYSVYLDSLLKNNSALYWCIPNILYFEE